VDPGELPRDGVREPGLLDRGQPGAPPPVARAELAPTRSGEDDRLWGHALGVVAQEGEHVRVQRDDAPGLGLRLALHYAALDLRGGALDVDLASDQIEVCAAQVGDLSEAQVRVRTTMRSLSSVTASSPAMRCSIACT
jgi:hypothetical protein